MSEQSLYLFAYVLLLGSGLIIFRINVRREYRKHGRLTIIPATLQAAFFFIYGGFPALYLAEDWPVVYVNQFQHLIGLFLIILGLALLLYGMFFLGFLRSLGQGQPELKQAGLYRFTRNPQALACGCFVLGFTLLWPSWYALGWALLYVILIHTMVLTEEEHLRRIHGPEYEVYSQQVPRYLRWRSASEHTSD
jgi:protein-S-isoprenylcysteine O-methyltransferase Ste14